MENGRNSSRSDQLSSDTDEGIEERVSNRAGGTGEESGLFSMSGTWVGVEWSCGGEMRWVSIVGFWGSVNDRIIACAEAKVTIQLTV